MQVVEESSLVPGADHMGRKRDAEYAQNQLTGAENGDADGAQADCRFTALHVVPPGTGARDDSPDRGSIRDGVLGEAPERGGGEHFFSLTGIHERQQHPPRSSR